MKDIWNEICYELNNCIENNVLEKEYENTIINCLGKLGWLKYKGEILTQLPIQVGHEKKFADIVIKRNDVELFAIEVKRPNHSIQDEDEKQLFSYMRMLNHRVMFGISISNKIHLYYDGSHQLPEQVFTVDITKNNVDGIKFVELFSANTFSIEKLVDFCKEQIKAKEEKTKLNNELELILSDTEGSIFKELLSAKFRSEGYSQTHINELLEQFTLKVLPSKQVEVPVPIQLVPQQIISKPKRKKDTTKYSLCGSGKLFKNRFVLEVVRKFVKENPMSYIDYVSIINKLRDDSFNVIEPLESAKDGRYFKDEEDIIISADGIKFVVCTEWSYFNLKPIVQFAERQGYDVVAYPK